jgi:TolA-binding protein
MAPLGRWLLFFFALALGGGPVFAASVREERAYAAAVSAFREAMWSRAEMEFAQFIQKYPKSAHVPEVLLLQAEAEFKQGKYRETIALLTHTNNLAKAGTLADQYVYWVGEAQFASSNFSAAADTFVSLSRHYPESRLRLPAVVAAASAQAQVREWPQLIALLRETNGVFRRAEQMDPGNEHVSDGRLLLAQALSAQNDLGGSDAVLASLDPRTLKPEQDWQRVGQLCRNRLAAGDLDAALAATTNLTQIVLLQNNADWSADAQAMRGTLLERLNRLPEAVAAYGENLKPGAPVERQRQAILKIAELALAQRQFANAELTLEKFLAQFPGSSSADVALLTLGELQLKDHLAARPAEAETNHLSQALASFNQFIGSFTNSVLLGRAYLDRGWCLWRAGKFPESFDSFQAATQQPLPAEELAVARFKMGDALFAQTNYAGALTNYQAVLTGFTRFPAVAQALGDRALYQSLRACLELKNPTGASNAMAQILKFYPASNLADNSLLLVGEGYADSLQPANARALFQKFEGLFPGSALRPQVELAIARTYEQEQNWSAALGQYDRWLGRFAAPEELRPQAEYARAQANFRAGNQTNAFRLFTNFVAQFPTNPLAPQAQWWVADHFFGAGDFVDAEKNYQLLFQDWPASDLAYWARMMAGHAAMARLGYSDAIRHFTSLTSDTNCPADLNAQALFAYGSALMCLESADTNKPLANFQLAIKVFSQLCQLYPTNELRALAWDEIGKCDMQLTNYDEATNAFAQVINSSFAKVSARSQAQIGLGLALEKKAALVSGNDQTQLLQLALNNYLDVLDTSDGENLRDDEVADPFWVEKAGLQALPLMEALGMADAEKLERFFDRLERLFPQLRDSLEKKKAEAQGHLPPAKK